VLLFANDKSANYITQRDSPVTATFIQLQPAGYVSLVEKQ